jgi:hypothetical protein
LLHLLSKIRFFMPASGSIPHGADMSFDDNQQMPVTSTDHGPRQRMLELTEILHLSNVGSVRRC